MKSKWFFSLINIAAICLIAMSIFVLLTVVLTPAGQVPQVMGFSVLRVLTGSMKPEIPADSMLLIQKADAACSLPTRRTNCGRKPMHCNRQLPISTAALPRCAFSRKTALTQLCPMGCAVWKAAT